MYTWYIYIAEIFLKPPFSLCAITITPPLGAITPALFCRKSSPKFVPGVCDIYY